MPIKIITIASDPNFPGLQKLKYTLEYFGYSYEVIVKPFQFGRQMQHIYEWCLNNTGDFLYTDAYDTVALGSSNELYGKLPKCEMLISCEKACYPNPDLASEYPTTKHEWRFVNGGGFCSSTDYFIKLYEDGSHHGESNDQLWLSQQFLKRKPTIKLDYDCAIFQSIAFEGEKDFAYENNRVINNFTKEKGIFIHGNGHTDLSKVYSILP